MLVFLDSVTAQAQGLVSRTALESGFSGLKVISKYLLIFLRSLRVVLGMLYIAIISMVL